MRICFPLAIFVSLVFLISCQRDIPPAVKDVQIKKIVTTNTDKSVYTNDYFYDSEKKLLRMELSSTLYSWKRIVDLEYDIDKLLKKATYRTVNDSNIVTQYGVSYSFIYDNKNNIIKRIGTTSQPGQEVNDHTYSYDIRGRLIADTTIDKKTAKQDSYRKFYWSSDNDIIKEEHYSLNQSGNFVLGTVYEYAYDRNFNPYLNLPVYFVNSYVSLYLSNQNIVSFKHAGQVTNVYGNEYNSAGLLTKKTSTPVQNTSLSHTVEFYYQ